MLFTDLSCEIIGAVVSILDVDDQARLACVSQALHKAVLDVGALRDIQHRANDIVRAFMTSIENDVVDGWDVTTTPVLRDADSIKRHRDMKKRFSETAVLPATTASMTVGVHVTTSFTVSQFGMCIVDYSMGLTILKTDTYTASIPENWCTSPYMTALTVFMMRAFDADHGSNNVVARRMAAFCRDMLVH